VADFSKECAIGPPVRVTVLGPLEDGGEEHERASLVIAALSGQVVGGTPGRSIA
jgi:hypothetical protein